MKLRNKKTGERGWIGNCTNDFIVVYPVNERWEACNDEKCVYFTISDFCEEWEDAKEPLIKDEKVKKLLGEVVELELTVNELSKRFDEFNKHYAELCEKEEE